MLCCALLCGGPRWPLEAATQREEQAGDHRCTAAPLHRCTATSWHLCLLFLGGGKWQAPAEPRLRGTAAPRHLQEPLSSLTKPSWLCAGLPRACTVLARGQSGEGFLLPTSPEDCLAKGDAQHLDARMPCVQALCTATLATRRSRRAALCSGNRSGSEVTFCRQENSVEDRPMPGAKEAEKDLSSLRC